MVRFSYTLLQIAALVEKWSAQKLATSDLRALMEIHEGSGFANIRSWIKSMTIPPLRYHSGGADSWATALKELSLSIATPDRDLVPSEFGPAGLVISSRINELIEFESSKTGEALQWCNVGHSMATRWFRAALEADFDRTVALFIPHGVRSVLAIWNHETRQYSLYCSR